MAISDAPHRTPRRMRGAESGVQANERLTGLTGAILIPLLAVIGLTIVRLGQLLSVHLFVGMMLIAPITLKMASTGYRFAFYYLGRPSYRRKGPPHTPLRLLGVPVVALTVIVLISGVVMLLGGPSTRQPWLLVHKVSFIAWLVVMALHVLAHLRGAADAVAVDLSARGMRPAGVTASGARLLLVGAGLVIGVVIALVAMPDFGPWTHYEVIRHLHHR